ncbi:vWA domain-containing protein [Luteolibacter sp. AS25]|uniref:vWA domain-containing protein n=1 Tax=Luteolibacter sp. AS25 TaxID=3135776 RepID=UPI00398B7EB2
MNFAHPLWLLVWIAVPILAVGAVLAGRLRKEPLGRFAAERLHGRLIRKDHPLPRWLSLSLLFAAIIALGLTMARPQGDSGVKKEKTTGRNVMVALDLSRSMRVQDVKPDRLSQAKILIYEMLETFESDRVGMVGFAGTPFLFAPLTIDHSAVRETVEQVNEEWPTVGGSDLAAAIKLSIDTLKETGQKNNALIVISDGEEHEGDLDAIIAEADRAGVTIFAIGIGTEDGGFVPNEEWPGGFQIDQKGTKVLSRLQPDVLRKLANETGGRYVIAGSTSDIPGMIESAIQGMDSFEVEAGQTRIVVEFFQWALLPAILFLGGAIIAGTRWRGIAATGAAILLVFSPQDVSADPATDARKSFADKRYGDARDGYRALAEEHDGQKKEALYRLGEGTAAYEAQDYRAARMAYSRAMLSEETGVVLEAHKGMGNTLFQLGWLGLSGSSYGEGGEAPDMKKFDELVKGQLKKMSEAEVPETGDTNEFVRFQAIILNWTDAVRHFHSASQLNPDDVLARRNSEVTMTYLKRLEELLKEEKEEAEQELQQAEQQAQGQPQPGEGEGEKDPNGEGNGGDGESDQGEGGDEEKEDGAGGDEDKDEDGEGEDGDEQAENPNESPEERARRILSENADMEKGPVSRGDREFRSPEKDW